MKHICVFCGSNTGVRSTYIDTTVELGRSLAAQGIGLVYGGGNIGLMGVLADAVLAAGGDVIGVIPRALKDKEVAHLSLTELHVVGSMHERKALMADLSDAFIALPGGYGTFDGVMTKSFRAPRIEGTFTGGRMRAFDVEWGDTRGYAVIENAYADVTDVVISKDGATVQADGRFSLGYPRRDGGEEINARIRIDGRPVADLKHAFTLDEYKLQGRFTGEFHVLGAYTRPYGFGTMQITDGVAYRSEEHTSELQSH